MVSNSISIIGDPHCTEIDARDSMELVGRANTDMDYAGDLFRIDHYNQLRPCGNAAQR